MKLPASSNSSTGGAALSRWSARTVLGRCRIQAWPRSSIETLDTWPHTYLLGSLGQDGSTSNFGISRVCAAAGFSPGAADMTMGGMASRQRAIARMVVLPLFHVIYFSLCYFFFSSLMWPLPARGCLDALC